RRRRGGPGGGAVEDRRHRHLRPPAGARRIVPREARVLTHRQLAGKLTTLVHGQAAVVLGIAVVRLPAGEPFEPAGSPDRLGGGAGLGLLAAVDRLAALAGLRAVAGDGWGGEGV